MKRCETQRAWSGATVGGTAVSHLIIVAIRDSGPCGGLFTLKIGQKPSCVAECEMKLQSKQYAMELFGESCPAPTHSRLARNLH
jgi:hypothetical protein